MAEEVRKKESRQKSEVVLLRFYPGERTKLAEFARLKGFDNLSDWARSLMRKAAKLNLPVQEKATRKRVRGRRADGGQ